MADIRKLTESLSVAPQLTANDLSDIKKMEFGSILCNRPDGEEEGQPAYEVIQEHAAAVGIPIEFQPVNGRVITDEDVQTFKQHIESMPQPVLAFCRTGTRCSVLWALSQAGDQATDEIISTAASAGYALDTLRERLDHRKQSLRDDK